MPHKFKMPQKYVDRMVGRLGREHVQESFETEKTALVVVDMQNYFLDESQLAGCPVGQTIVDNVNRLAGVVREAGRVEAGTGYETDADWPGIGFNQPEHRQRPCRFIAVDAGGNVNGQLRVLG